MRVRRMSSNYVGAYVEERSQAGDKDDERCLLPWRKGSQGNPSFSRPGYVGMYWRRHDMTVPFQSDGKLLQATRWSSTRDPKVNV